MTLLSDLSEAQVLDQILPLLRSGVPGAFPDCTNELIGPGDDAAVLACLDGPVIVTTDSMVRGLDWRDDWSTPQDVGIKLVTQNVADIEAMGGRCTNLVVALAADPATPMEWVRGLAEGVGSAAAHYGVNVSGGDLSAAPAGTLVISATAIGTAVGKIVSRAGAQAGDVVATSGSIGASGAGLMMLEQGHRDPADPTGEAFRVHLRPLVTPGAGELAAAGGATAMIDLSDGLVTDLGRIASASSVSIDLDLEVLARDQSALADPLSCDEAWQAVLHGGEEHSLLACFPGAWLVPEGWRVIGSVVAGPAGEVTLAGKPVPGHGWEHFLDGGGSESGGAQ